MFDIALFSMEILKQCCPTFFRPRHTWSELKISRHTLTKILTTKKKKKRSSPFSTNFPSKIEYFFWFSKTGFFWLFEKSFATHLEISRDTLVCRGTPVGQHCPKVYNRNSTHTLKHVSSLERVH